LLKFYTDHIEFYFLIAICEFCYNLLKPCDNGVGLRLDLPGS